jgi:hypothetical protein
METQNIIENKGFVFRGMPMVVGKAIVPLKGIIYGDNGAGKTDLLSRAKNSIIMDMEGNCSHIEASKYPINTMDVFDDFLHALDSKEHDYKTLVIDSIDSLQTLIGEKIARSHTTQELSYGKSADIWARYIKDIVAKLEMLSEKKGMSILFTGHVKTKSANNPMTEQYDRYDLRINESMRTGFCNWVQFICLLQKEPILDEMKGATGFGKKKAKNVVRRVLYTRGDPTYYGKNVFNLPEKILIPDDPVMGAQKGWEQFITNVKKFYSN